MYKKARESFPHKTYILSTILTGRIYQDQNYKNVHVRENIRKGEKYSKRGEIFEKRIEPFTNPVLDGSVRVGSEQRALSGRFSSSPSWIFYPVLCLLPLSSNSHHSLSLFFVTLIQPLAMADTEQDLLDYEEEEEQTATNGANASAANAVAETKKGGYVSIHSSGFRDFLLKPELLRAIIDCGFEHPRFVSNSIPLKD